MGVSVVLRLNERWAEVLASQPETGMGYQVATIVLKDGRRFDNITIVGGTISSLPDARLPPFVDEDIAEIVVTHGSPSPSK
jgi:hypothetical protein